MQIIGIMDSPFVRRVAITARLLGLNYEHRPLSIFSSYDEFRLVHPLVKVPTLVCDNGEMLVDSNLIIDYLESLTSESLMPSNVGPRQSALKNTGIALVAMEKVAQLIYETKQRPEELKYTSWVARLRQQLESAVELMEQSVGNGQSWMFGGNISQADLSTAVAWHFTQYIFPDFVDKENYPALEIFSERAESTPEFRACPLP